MAADEVLITGEIVRDERGRLTLDVTDEAKRFLARAIAAFKKEGPCTLHLKAGREPKSVKQLRRAHKLIAMMAEHTGNSARYMKDYLKERFLTREEECVDPLTGEQKSRTYVPSLADLSMEEMTEFMSEIELFGNEELSMTFERDAA